MLILYFASLDASLLDPVMKRRLRICILNQLFRENYDFFHQSLSASSLRIVICRMYFARDIGIDVDRVAAMRSVSVEVRKRGGFLMSTPEHILSLKLKHLELYHSGEKIIGPSLCAMLADIQKKEVGVFDESDAVLCHRYQLVYAMGTPEALPNGRIRWSAFQALLYVMNNSVGEVSRLINAETAAVFKGDVPSFAWSHWRLRHNCSEIRPALRSALLREMIDSPPNREFRWLKTLRNATFRSKIESIVLNQDSDAMKLISEMQQAQQIIESDHVAILLILRGLLAMGIFEHVLEQRYRVDYGRSVVKEGATIGKQLAVPYRSTDVPAERAEFSQPDVAIGLTVVMFWTSGLSEKELKDVINALLRSSTSSRNYIYGLWLDQVRTSLTPFRWQKSTVLRRLISTTQLSGLLFMRPFIYALVQSTFTWINACSLERHSSTASK